ncbi:hypothetical protein [Gimesia panareensis]|uniref:hypothetical protein n=1 Tax=Gimesia panareensis TaxID=2527978 RepID=UPI0011898024|nr:hypothetical protein [Gimesia panareensis]QDU51524.1 hypothetical protein Pan110_38900 [Gimesia panareensis]
MGFISFMIERVIPMKKFSIIMLALLTVLCVSEVNSFAQRGGHGGGHNGGGGHRGGFSGGGSHHGGMSRGSISRGSISRGSISRGSSHRGSISRSMSSPSRSFSHRSSGGSIRHSSPSRSFSQSLGRSSGRSSHTTMRPGNSTHFSPGSSRNSSRHSPSFHSFSQGQRSLSGNPGLHSGNRSHSGSRSLSNSRSFNQNFGSRQGSGITGFRSGGSQHGITSQHFRGSTGGRMGGIQSGFGSSHQHRNPGLRSGGQHHAGHNSPGLRSGRNYPRGNNYQRYAGRSYHYNPGYWSGYRTGYGFGIGFGYGAGYGYYGRGYGYYPYYHYRRYGYRPWVWATYGGLASWIGYNSLTPVVYNYSISNGYICNNGAQIAPVSDYASQANQIADSVTPPDQSADWMPVGLFAIVPQGTKDVNVTVQLAVSKNGAVAGTYFNKEGNITLPLQGAIDETKQRVVWKVGEEDAVTMETGLDSLTKDKSTVVLYFNDGVSEVWDMVRIDQDVAKLAQQELQNDELKYQLLGAHQALDDIVDAAWKDYLELPADLAAKSTPPDPAELEAVIANYQQVQVDSKYHMITDRQEFQNTYRLLKDYLKEVQHQQALEKHVKQMAEKEQPEKEQPAQVKLPAPPPVEQPELVAPKPVLPKLPASK